MRTVVVLLFAVFGSLFLDTLLLSFYVLRNLSFGKNNETPLHGSVWLPHKLHPVMSDVDAE